MKLSDVEKLCVQYRNQYGDLDVMVFTPKPDLSVKAVSSLSVEEFPDNQYFAVFNKPITKLK